MGFEIGKLWERGFRRRVTGIRRLHYISTRGSCVRHRYAIPGEPQEGLLWGSCLPIKILHTRKSLVVADTKLAPAALDEAYRFSQHAAKFSRVIQRH